ncbi:MAG: outer membrane protein assembly factor BamD [Desulfobacterales bacterium]|nr:outer membrane protein assembly factor BamD [Desulfobacterales bacterium]
MKAKYLLSIGMVLIVSLVLIGCAGKKKIPSVPKDPAVLYTEGMVLFNKGRYSDATEIFTRLKDYFPSDELYAPKADLRIADCYFFRKEYPETITRYMEFKKQHPFHPDIPYVEYQLGLCYYRQVLSKDRDQKATIKALTAFQNVVVNYPDSIFAQKAQEKIIFCRRRLAENELYIAYFYLRHGNYAATEKRSAATLAKYPASGVDDEALYYLALALHKQERDSEALTPLKQLVGDYPQSTFAKPGKKLLASLKTQGVAAASPAGEEVGMREARPLEKAGRTLPFRIIAKNTKNILEKNAILYTGDVVALGEEVTIHSQSLLVTMGDGNLPKEMIARDEVVVKSGEQELFSKKAVWSPIEKTMVLTEDAKIRGIGEWIRGDEITLHLDTGRIDIKGKKLDKIVEEPETHR